jgi:hypothetical protein
VLGNGKALRYGVGVGREGFTWSGTERVTKMAEWPDCAPEEMIVRQPYLPRLMAGGETNPCRADRRQPPQRPRSPRPRPYHPAMDRSGRHRWGRPRPRWRDEPAPFRVTLGLSLIIDDRPPKHRDHRGHRAGSLRAPMPPMPCHWSPRSRADQGIGRGTPFSGRLLARQDEAVGTRAASGHAAAPRDVGSPVLADRPRRALAPGGQRPSRAARRGAHAKRRTARRSDGGADRWI